MIAMSFVEVFEDGFTTDVVKQMFKGWYYIYGKSYKYRM